MNDNRLPENRFYVYHHTANKDFTLGGVDYKVGDVLYVGSGTARRFASVYRRSEQHKSVWDLLDKNIVVDGLNVDDKIKIEQKHIEKYGDALLNMRNAVKAKHISYDLFSQKFVIDAESKTGLSHAPTSHVYDYKIGKPAGTINVVSGYAYVSINAELFLAHRVIWCLHNKKDLSGDFLVDHIDGDHRNNAPENLRLATFQTNNFNRKLQSNNKSGVVGMKFVVKDDYHFWLARLAVSGKEISKTFNPNKLYPDLEYEDAVERAKQDCLNWRTEMVQKFYRHIENS